MDATFESAVDAAGRAAGMFAGGDPRPYRALWADGADVTIFGAWGAHEQGWDQVGPRLAWAGARFGPSDGTRQEVLAAGCDGDVGYSVSLERGEVRVAGRDEPAPMLLRVTHLYRRIDGDWKIVHRHADAIIDKVDPTAVLDGRSSPT